MKILRDTIERTFRWATVAKVFDLVDLVFPVLYSLNPDLYSSNLDMGMDITTLQN